MSWGSFESPSRDGFHDAALVEFSTKQDIVEVVVRELIQNSLDAISDRNKPVKVVFEIGEVKSVDIPDWIGLKKIFKLSKNFNERSWPGAFHTMNNCFNSNMLTYLKIVDSNTTGLSKKIKNSSKDVSTWDACVLADSQSVKGTGSSRGSFGIGKNAAFAFSSINTVFYSSFNDDESLFAGVSKLGGHSEDGVHFSSKKIYNGMPSKSVFDHVTGEPGLSQTIVGIEQSLENKLHVLLELYIYKHYIISLFEGNLAIEIRDVRNPRFDISIHAERKAEFVSFVENRLALISDKLTLRSFKNDLLNVGIVVKAISENPVALNTCYDALLNDEICRKYIDIEKIPKSWKGFCSKTRLSFFEDSSMSYNVIFHYRNGMFIDSKTFSSTYPVPVAIIHNVDEDLSSFYSNFETYSHDKWLKGLLKDRVEKDQMNFHFELFDFQRLLPKLLMIEINRDSIVDKDSLTERLVNNLLSGAEFNLASSQEGLRTPGIGGKLERQTLVRDGVMGSSNRPLNSSKGNKKRVKGDSVSPSIKSNGKSKIKTPLISSSNTLQGGTKYSFKFIDFPEGEYSLNRQGLNQMCELNLNNVLLKSGNALIHVDGEYIVISNNNVSTFNVDVIVDDRNVTQWKISN